MATNSECPIRIWLDGAFDMMHYGHANAFRQGKALGTYLIVGVNSDESITRCKGKPVTSEEERLATVRGCKWVDEVVTNVPYVMNDEYLAMIMEKYALDYIVHGDDPCIVDGKDVYESAQKLGKYRTIPRTEGISTTDIVGRILDHYRDTDNDYGCIIGGAASDRRLYHKKSNFLVTSRMLRLFSEHIKEPSASSRIVYVGGSWDMFHAGHLRVLETARALGDYLIVGIYSDAVAAQLFEIEQQQHPATSSSAVAVPDNPTCPEEVQGEGIVGCAHGSLACCGHFPVLSMCERALSVLGCRWADDVLLDAPFCLSDDFLSALKIDIVVEVDGEQASRRQTDEDPYLAAKRRGLHRSLSSTGPVPATAADPGPGSGADQKTAVVPVSVSAASMVQRIRSDQAAFAAKISRKRVQEEEYYAARYGDSGSGNNSA